MGERGRRKRSIAPTPIHTARPLFIFPIPRVVLHRGRRLGETARAPAASHARQEMGRLGRQPRAPETSNALTAEPATPSMSTPMNTTVSPVTGSVSESRILLRLSIPVVVAQVGMMMMGVIDTIMIARVGVPELAAVAIAATFTWAWGSLGQGVIHGMDPMVSQAHGAGNGDGAALALQRGLVIAVSSRFRSASSSSRPGFPRMAGPGSGSRGPGVDVHARASAGRDRVPRLHRAAPIPGGSNPHAPGDVGDVRRKRPQHLPQLGLDLRESRIPAARTPGRGHRDGGHEHLSRDLPRPLDSRLRSPRRRLATLGSAFHRSGRNSHVMCDSASPSVSRCGSRPMRSRSAC